MKLAVIGTGYVGLVSGTCFAALGHEVTCIDRDASKIATLKQGGIPIYEDSLQQLVQENAAASRLHFTTDLAAGLEGAEAIFIAVGTPVSALGHGGADLSYVYAVARDIAPHLKDDAVIVVKSTVPVGTGKRLREIISELRPGLRFEMVSNPEFLREGCAVKDFMEPDRIITGTETARGKAVMEALYAPLTRQNVPLLITDIPTAELTKYAANAFLATKIAFINEMADVCEQTNADVAMLAHGMGLDHRIGQDFLAPGPGFGGSCFPKDTLALKKIAQEHKSPVRIVEAVIAANDARKIHMVTKVRDAFGGSVTGKKIAVLGLAFKANTSDVRESAALALLPALVEQGAHVQVYDPAAMEEAKHALSTLEVQWCQSLAEVLQGADGAVIVTEWPEFRQLDLAAAKTQMVQPVLVDLRNCITPDAAKAAGFTYHSIGRASSA